MSAYIVPWCDVGFLTVNTPLNKLLVMIPGSLKISAYAKMSN